MRPSGNKMLQTGVECNMVELLDSNTLPAPVLRFQIVNQHAQAHSRMAEIAKSIESDLQSVDLPLRHYFSPGVCARAMYLPANVQVVGKIHKHENMLMMVQGEADLFDGYVFRRVKAPQIWVTPAGSQRAALAITDCIFVSVLGTHKTDVDEIEEDFVVSTPAEYEQFLLENHTEGA